jgi:molybdopterin biosynthesis enzyme
VAAGTRLQPQHLGLAASVGVAELTVRRRPRVALFASGDELVYQIVGESEADLGMKRISIASPLARALIGKEVGDEVRIPGKGGARTVEIVELKFTQNPP